MEETVPTCTFTPLVEDDNPIPTRISPPLGGTVRNSESVSDPGFSEMKVPFT